MDTLRNKLLNELQTEAPVIQEPEPAGPPPITIVIPTLDEAKGKATGEVATLSAGCPVRIEVVVDSRRQGFSKTVNKGLKRTATEDVCILNDDIEWFQYGWLDILRIVLHSKEQYGITAPGGRSSTGPMKRGVVGLYGTQEVDHAPFWCVLVKRVAFDRIGYLDEELIHYGSDNLFCKALKESGLLTVWVKSVFLKHTHHGSGLIEEWKERDDWKIAQKFNRL